MASTNRPCFIGMAALLGLLNTADATAQATAQALQCNLDQTQSAAAVQVQNSTDGVTLFWNAADSQQLNMLLAIEQGQPVIRSLEIREAAGPWIQVLQNARIEYQIVEGMRRISNQQLAPLRSLGVELTQEIVDLYKWDAFWDAPLDLREEVSGGNPPPAEGIANQPGLPRSADEIRRAEIEYQSNSCRAITDGARAKISFSGVSLGSFEGEFSLTVYAGTNLIRSAVEASTSRPSVAYKYDVGLSGISNSQSARVFWRDTGGQMQSYGLAGPENVNQVAVTAANRLLVAETDAAAIATFPPPHTFFWAREVEINVGNNWYRKDSDTEFSIGIRQGEQEVVERYLANWSLYSAPPGSVQQMVGYFYPVAGDASAAFAAALAFTNNDVYRPLPGYKVMGSHYHTNMGRELMATGNIDSRLRDFEVLKSAGIDIAGPVDRPQDASQLEELHWLFEGARRHSDTEFMVLPEMENSNLLGGHWDLLFSHPVYYVDDRPEGTPLVTEHPRYGKQYNIGSIDDVMTMVEAENMLIYMPHPRTKGSTGFPDAIADSEHFLSNRYRGVGWRWGMGSDLSEKRLSENRVIPLLDDMNNWIADTDLQLKYLLAITETYFKAPGDDIYANGPVSYIRLDELPVDSDYSPVIEKLKTGDYFVTSGEVLIPSHRVIVNDNVATIEAEVQWTFPLDFVEVITGDGRNASTVVVSATELAPFSSNSFEIPFDASGQSWVRFAAWDSAGNGAMTMPQRLDR